jgi:hypothetical protein
MKKTVITIFIINLILVLITSGCTENNQNGTAKTYTWTAKQVVADIPIDTDWNDGIQMLYNTLKDGDTLIIQDTITNISYDPDTNTTLVTFEWAEGNETNSLNPTFEGDITGYYQPGSNVKITVTIKYVKLTYQSVNFEMEIYEEQWVSEEDFISDLDSGGEGLKPLPQSCIEIV